ncbi:MAG TPA: hypothetical protein VNQ77_11020 [Frankiaceae bacterium]|nr:hypothetical protein [Frankiaceae bacterium]
MRRTLAVAALGLATAAVALPVQSASAVCITPYYAVTGHCSPCTTVDNVTRYLHDKLGTPETVTNCVA